MSDDATMVSVAELALEQLIISREQMKTSLSTVIESNLTYFDSLKQEIGDHKRDADDSMRSHASTHRMSQRLMQQLAQELEAVERLKRQQKIGDKLPTLLVLGRMAKSLSKQILDLESSLAKKKRVLAEKREELAARQNVFEIALAEDKKRHALMNRNLRNKLLAPPPGTPPDTDPVEWVKRLEVKAAKAEEAEFGLSRKKVLAAVEADEQRRKMKRNQEEDSLDVSGLLESQHNRVERIKAHLVAVRALTEK